MVRSVFSRSVALTVNALPAGVEVVSRSTSKVTPRVAPLTVALWNAGAVALLTDWSPKVATAVPLLPSSAWFVGWV